MKALILIFGLMILCKSVSADEQKIVEGCVVSILVSEEAEISGEREIDSTGLVHFRIGEADAKYHTEWSVKLAGKTPKEAQEALTSSLKLYYKNPDVTLKVLKYPKKSVEIFGPVKLDGVIRISLDGRLSDAIAIAGIQQDADLTRITIVRKIKSNPPKPKETAKTERLLIDFMASDAESDPLLFAGDRIYLVSKPVIKVAPPIAIIRVMGEVGREGAYPMKNGTVRDALLLAGGLKLTANREKILLIRAKDTKYLPLDADKVMDGDPVHNLPVDDRDIINVEKADQSQFVSLEGEVRSPGRFLLKEGEKLNLLALLEKTGGPTKNAEIKKGVLRKNYFRDPINSRLIPFNLDNVRKGKEPNWEIEQGDQILFGPKIKRPSLFQRLLPILMNFLPFGI